MLICGLEDKGRKYNTVRRARCESCKVLVALLGSRQPFGRFSPLVVGYQQISEQQTIALIIAHIYPPKVVLSRVEKPAQKPSNKLCLVHLVLHEESGPRISSVFV